MGYPLETKYITQTSIVENIIGIRKIFTAVTITL
jgi:hypothetical protein